MARAVVLHLSSPCEAAVMESGHVTHDEHVTVQEQEALGHEVEEDVHALAVLRAAVVVVVTGEFVRETVEPTGKVDDLSQRVVDDVHVLHGRHGPAVGVVEDDDVAGGVPPQREDSRRSEFRGVIVYYCRFHLISICPVS